MLSRVSSHLQLLVMSLSTTSSISHLCKKTRHCARSPSSRGTTHSSETQEASHMYADSHAECAIRDSSLPQNLTRTCELEHMLCGFWGRHWCHARPQTGFTTQLLDTCFQHGCRVTRNMHMHRDRGKGTIALPSHLCVCQCCSFPQLSLEAACCRHGKRLRVVVLLT